MQNPYKKCRRSFGKRICNGTFDLMEETKSNLIFECDSCSRELVLTNKEHDSFKSVIDNKRERYNQRREETDGNIETPRDGNDNLSDSENS